MKQKFLEATKHILEDNLQLHVLPYSEKKVVLVYDTDSLLSIEVAE